MTIAPPPPRPGFKLFTNSFPDTYFLQQLSEFSHADCSDANSPAFGGTLALFFLVSRSPALVHKSPAFYVHYKY